MPVLNLRDVPEELMRELRAQAALRGAKFHPFCVDLLAASAHALSANRTWSEQHPAPPDPKALPIVQFPAADPTEPPPNLELEIT